MIRARCLGNWHPRRDRAAHIWLTAGASYPLLEVLARPTGDTLVRIPLNDLHTPALWPARYFEFDSAAEDWVARTDSGSLSFSPRELADIDWFTLVDHPDEVRMRVEAYLDGN